jgi:hypothetical protein
VGGLVAVSTLSPPLQSVDAQTLDPEPSPASSLSMPCPPSTVPGTPDPLTRSLVSEWTRLTQHWCKVSRWDEPWPSVQDFAVAVFTGPGVHPTAGIVVPGGGLAGGLALNLDWRLDDPAYERFAASIEGRRSENGFWELGGKMQILFAGYSESGRSPRLTLLATHLDLPQLSFYGLGNDTSRHNRTNFGLRETRTGVSVDAPVPLGFTLSGEVDGLWFTPDPSPAFASTNNEAAAPGLHTSTAYVRPRLSAAWSYPDSGALYGVSSAAAVSYGLYEALSGGRYSFSRLDARWSVGLGLDPRFGAFRFSSRLVLSEPHARNRMPFYLQPTLGGADIKDENLLRGYNNYRFRAPNLVAYEISYERQIVDPVGLRVFGELGRVGLHPGDLGFDGLKSSAGVSITFRLGGATVAELSLGWSAAEGMHVYATGNSNNIGGLTAGVRGVF